MRKSEVLVLAIILASFILSAYIYPQLPDTLASHWNASGNVNGYMPKIFALFIMPAVSLVLFLLFVAIPRVDPLKQNIAQFRKYFDGFVVLIVLFLLYVHAFTILWNLGYTFDIIQVLVPAFAVLFFYLGILLENSKRNWFIGIRTPWTMSSDRVWESTHKTAGKLFKIFAVVSLAGFFAGFYTFFIILGLMFAVVIYSVVFSYFEYMKEKRPHRPARRQPRKRARK